MRSAAPARSSRLAHPAAGVSRTATRSSSFRRASAPASTPTCGSTCRERSPWPGLRAPGLRTTSRIGWTVPPGSTLRLQQLLAQAGYLPLDWTPDGAPVARTPAAELQAAVNPPKGHFSWRYPNTPSELQALWSEGSPNQVTRGAVMMFQDTHGLAVDAIARRAGAGTRCSPTRSRASVTTSGTATSTSTAAFPRR